MAGHFRTWSSWRLVCSENSGRKCMPRGASPKREREYEELKEKFHKAGEYKGREEEVAARIVNKQRAEHGETKKSSKKK
jgi:hypothetical protein